MSGTMTITLNVWRQSDRNSEGRFARYTLPNVSPDMSFLEMLDLLNLDLVRKGEEPVAFDHDCREGICGTCSLYINGRAHGPLKGVTACQLHMRTFHDGETITVEPWRAKPFHVIKDLVVDRSAFDRIMAAGGFVSVHTGGAPDANATLIAKAGWRLDHHRLSDGISLSRKPPEQRRGFPRGFGRQPLPHRLNESFTGARGPSPVTL